MNTLFLNETIYYREEDLQVIDNAFKEFCNGNFDKKYLKDISDTIKKMFNMTNVKIGITNEKKLEYAMRIYPSYEELKNKAMKVKENKITGYTIKNCHDVIIEIQKVFIELTKKHSSTPERLLTATLLHEIGHKVLIKQSTEERKRYVVAALKHIGIDVLLICNGIFKPQILLLFLINNQFFKRRITLSNAKFESISDSLAVKYNRGKEMYEVLEIFRKDTINTTTERKDLLAKVLVLSNPLYKHIRLRKKMLIKNIKLEISQSSSKLEKEYLKKLLKDIKELK